MQESLESFKSAREILLNLESDRKYVFHGSDNPHLEILEPRQAYTMVEGEKEDDDKPGVHASPFADIAILMAIINLKNCNDGFNSGFETENGKLILSADQKALDQLDETAAGYVYVFAKEDFISRGGSQVISYLPVKPIRMIEVKKEDLSKDIVIEE